MLVRPPETRHSSVHGVFLRHGAAIGQASLGFLTAAEAPTDIPFEPRRFFLVYDVPAQVRRGEHAHKNCQQFLICVSGSLQAKVDNGRSQDSFRLDRPNLGLYMPPLTWGQQFDYSPGAVLLVLASHVYDPDDYIRNYEEFLQIVRAR